jgi:hypothetical protein
MLRVNQTSALADKLAQLFELESSKSENTSIQTDGLSKGRSCEPLGELSKARRRRLRRARALVQT